MDRPQCWASGLHPQHHSHPRLQRTHVGWEQERHDKVGGPAMRVQARAPGSQGSCHVGIMSSPHCAYVTPAGTSTAEPAGADSTGRRTSAGAALTRVGLIQRPLKQVPVGAHRRVAHSSSLDVQSGRTTTWRVAFTRVCVAESSTEKTMSYVPARAPTTVLSSRGPIARVPDSRDEVRESHLGWRC